MPVNKIDKYVIKLNIWRDFTPAPPLIIIEVALWHLICELSGYKDVFEGDGNLLICI